MHASTTPEEGSLSEPAVTDAPTNELRPEPPHDELFLDEADQPEDDAPLEGERRVHAQAADAEVDSLYHKHKRGKLVVQPEFQRQYVWDHAKASRLIESALLAIPLPIVYLSTEADNKEYVIDGQQRLTSFFAFIDGRYPDGKPFRLEKLTVLADLNGRTFAELNEGRQDLVRYYTIRTITFTRDSDPDLKFEIFERLNTGAVSLNDQELRNCVYRGPYNELLKELAADPEFRRLTGLRTQEKRMRDVELVLRFAALYHATYLKYKPPMRRFLNHDMQAHWDISEADVAALRKAFRNAVHNVGSLFGEHAFKRFYRGDDRNPAGRWETKRFNSSLYDILMNTLADVDRNRLYRHLDGVREALLDLMTQDQEFIDAIELSTSSERAVRKRFDKWRAALETALAGDGQEPRCFSYQLKEELYAADPTCAICGNRIQHLDDGALDHIEQYWAGGRTVPENARLTHRYCNWARPRKDVAQA